MRFVVVLLLVGCSASEVGLGDVDVRHLREQHVDDPPRDFEYFFPSSQSAEDVLARGWQVQGEPALQLTPPIDWHAAETTNRSWSFGLNAWHPLAILLDAYASTGERRFLDPALALAEDWLVANPRTTDPPVRDTFQWYDMAVGLRTYILAYLVDVTRRIPDVPDEQLRRLWFGLLVHLEYLADDANIAFQSNHGYFQSVGQLAAATRFAWIPEMETAAEQAAARIERIMSEHFASDGVHREHSPGYHRAVVGDWWTLLEKELLDASWGPALTARVENALGWMIQPNGTLAMLGDTGNIDVLDDLAGRDVTSPVLRHVLGDGPAPEERVAAFAQGGLVVMRTWEGRASSYLAMQCGFHSRTHKHADDLAIVWYDRGRDILIGPGIYGYIGHTEKGSPLAELGFWYDDPARVYVESTAGQNTVEIDGTSHDRKNRAPYGSGVLFAEEQRGLLVGSCRAPQVGGVVHTRVVVAAPGEWLLVVDLLDDADGDAHAYRPWFHFAPALEVERRNATQLAITGGETSLVATSLLEGGAWSAPIRGQDEPMQGWWAPDYRTLEPATAVALEHPRASRAGFATLFSFGETMVADITGSDLRLRWGRGKSAREIEVRGIDGPRPIVAETAR